MICVRQISLLIESGAYKGLRLQSLYAPAFNQLANITLQILNAVVPWVHQITVRSVRAFPDKLQLEACFVWSHVTEVYFIGMHVFVVH